MRTLDDLGDVAGKRVFVRVDFNVPLDGRADHRRRADPRGAADAARSCAAAARAAALLAHLGRPKGRDPELSLAPVAARLGELLGERRPARDEPDAAPRRRRS